MMIWVRVCVGLMMLGTLALVPDLASSRSSGAPAGWAGDIIPNVEPRTCVVCHSGEDVNDATSGSSITINAPDSAVPGETIDITVVLVNNTPQSGSVQRQGFLATVKNPADSLFVGSFTIPDPVTVRLADSNDAYVTHTSAGNGQTTWSFQWTVPSTDVPSEVVIYVAGNAANGNFSTSGDFIYTDTHALSLTAVASEEGPTADIGVDWVPLYPNPVRGAARAELVLAVPTNVEIRLVDGQGRRVRAVASGMRPAGASSVALNVRDLAPGTYFLIAETETGRRTQALSIVR